MTEPGIIVLASASQSSAALAGQSMTPAAMGLMLGRARQALEDLEKDIAGQIIEDIGADAYARFVEGVARGLTAKPSRDSSYMQTTHPEQNNG